MIRCTSILIATAFALSAAAMVEARPGKRHRHGPEHLARFLDEVAETVAATDEQIAQLDTIAEEHEAAMTAARDQFDNLTEAQREEARTLRRQLRAAHRAGNEEQVTSLREQLTALTGHDRRAMQESLHASVAAILTPEQLTQFEALVESKKEGKGKGRHGRRGMRGGGAGRHLDRFVEELITAVDATEEQEAQLRAIVAEQHQAGRAARAQRAEAMKANRDALKTLRAELREAVEDGDEEMVATIRGQIQTLIGGGDRKGMMRQTMEKMADVLSEEQLPAFQTLVQDFKAKHAKGRQRGNGERGRGCRDR
jgi:Spy/CpxP family protein refolding chaperone